MDSQLCRYNNTSLLGVLISAGANLTLLADCYYPLKCIEYLIDNGADVNEINTDGITPLYRALYDGVDKEATLLIRKGADIRAMEHKTGISTLYIAIEVIAGIDVLEMLFDGGADINMEYTDGTKSPLILAIANGSDRMTKLLVSKGANVNIVADDTTPLIEAAKQDSDEIVKYLLDNGADINQTDSNNASALHYSVSNNVFGHTASSKNVALTLIARGIDTEIRTDGLTAIELAYRHNKKFGNRLVEAIAKR